MENKEIIDYVKTLVIEVLQKSGHTDEIKNINTDTTNQRLLFHIKGLKGVLTIAETTIERR